MTEAWHIAVFYFYLACGDRNAYNISYPVPILTVHFILAPNGMEDGDTNKPMRHMCRTMNITYYS